jgi:hypothetical protein
MNQGGSFLIELNSLPLIIKNNKNIFGWNFLGYQVEPKKKGNG